jgi:hypothetical protein
VQSAAAIDAEGKQDMFRDPATWLYAVLAAVAVAARPEAALAYVGPGAGLTAIGTVLALLGAVALALVGFVWYPVKRLLRRPAGPDPKTEAPRK